MTISNPSNGYIQLQSDLISQILGDPGSYQEVDVTGTINCCTPNAVTATLPITIGSSVDLSPEVALGNTISKITLRNLVTGFDSPITVAIDLSYVETNCISDPCTMQDFSGHFTPLFKTAIDNFFTSVGITSNVTITITGNIVKVTNLPANFLALNVISGPDNTIYIFGVGTNILLTAEGLLISPAFFDPTLTAFAEGIYNFSVKIVKIDHSYTIEGNCFFFDVTAKCKVAFTLNNIIKEQCVKGTEEIATMLHLLHYALTNGSNCGCNCADLCTVYRELLRLLDTIDPSTIPDCGC